MKQTLFRRWRTALVATVAIAGLALTACSNPMSSGSVRSDSASRVLANDFRVVGYSANWVGSAEQINYDHLTNIVYAFAIPDSNGNIISMDNSAKLQAIVNYGHAKGIKISLAVGGWSYNGVELDPTFESLGGNAGARTNLVNNLINLVNQYNLDGIDVDWEYPNNAGNYTALMAELGNALKSRGKLLSAAVGASAWSGDAVSADVISRVDFLNIMAYDGDAGAGHSPYSYAVSALDYWIGQRGLPAAKANLGVPFYARPSWSAYNTLVAQNPSVVPNADYYNGDYYNGIPTIKAKTTLAMQRAGGIMIWELSQDTSDATSLLSAIWSVASAGGNNGGISTTSPLFMIVGKNSGKALDLIGGDQSNGARINQWSFDYNGPNQRWQILPTENGHFKLISLVSGQAACIDGDSLDNAAQLHTWPYIAGNTSHQWDLIDAGNGWYKIRNVRSGKMLDVDGFNTNNDGKVQQWDDNGGQANQLWRIQPWGDYLIKAASGRYVCIADRGSSNGNRIIQYDLENNLWFKWHFDGVGDGWYKLWSLNAPGRVLCVADASTAAAYWCHLWDYNPNNIGDQKIRIQPLVNGKFKFYFAHDGMSWDIPGGRADNTAPLQQYPGNGNSWQEFSLERLN